MDRFEQQYSHPARIVSKMIARGLAQMQSLPTPVNRLESYPHKNVAVHQPNESTFDSPQCLRQLGTSQIGNFYGTAVHRFLSKSTTVTQSSSTRNKASHYPTRSNGDDQSQLFHNEQLNVEFMYGQYGLCHGFTQGRNERLR